MNATTQPGQHTPGPWHVRDLGTNNIWVEAKALGSRFVCDMEANESDNTKERAQIQANAAFIVLACNAHEELLEWSRTALDTILWYKENGLSGQDYDINGLETAIAKATLTC